MKTLTKRKYNKSDYSYKTDWNGIPATSRQSLFEVSISESVFVSLCCHVIGVLLIWLLTFTFIFFGLAPKLFPKPKPQTRDIEFIIKKQATYQIKQAQLKSTQSTSEQNSIQKTESNNVSTDISHTVENASKKNTTNNKKTASVKQPTNSVIPDFSMPMPNLKSISSNLANSGRTKSHAAGIETSNSSISDTGSTSGISGGTSNHTGFDKNSTKNIITTYDISPYINELKRTIRWNWKSPNGNENKKVELFLRIAKDGRIIILNVKRTSEIDDIDNAALTAVKKCIPLNPLPSKYSKSYLDVIFTFSSNSVSSRY